MRDSAVNWHVSDVVVGSYTRQLPLRQNENINGMHITFLRSLNLCLLY